MKMQILTLQEAIECPLRVNQVLTIRFFFLFNFKFFQFLCLFFLIKIF